MEPIRVPLIAPQVKAKDSTDTIAKLSDLVKTALHVESQKILGAASDGLETANISCDDSLASAVQSWLFPR